MMVPTWNPSNRRTDMTSARVCAAAALLLIPALAACGEDGASQPAPGPSNSQVSSTGSAVIDLADGQQEFALQNCTATADGSVQAAGSNSIYAVTISIQSGSGEVLLANQSDLQDTVEALIDSVQVDDDGAFQLEGTYQNPQGEQDVSISGACG